MAKRGPIPTEIDLGSALIHVKLVTKKQMIEALENEMELKEDEALQGLWDAEEDTIYIGKWLPIMVQRWILFHELVHACIDLRDRFEKD